MNTPSPLLYNYRALIISVNAVDKVTALVDQGFRSWSMRLFKLAGVIPTDPRSKPPGQERIDIREALVDRQSFLNSILKPEGKEGTNVLVCPEKPSYAGTFAAGLFMPCKKVHPVYCINHAGRDYLSICALMRHLSSGDIGVAAAQDVVRSVGPTTFHR
jgi:hypothetical protein